MPAGSVEVSPESITPDSFMAGQTAVEIPREAPGQPGRVQLAFQNNNPGNLRNTDGSWKQYSTPAEGYADLQSKIRAHAWRGDTLEDYLGAYAPPNENDTEGYIQNAEKALGVPRGTKLTALDREKLAQFQAKQESSSRVKGSPSELTPESFMADPLNAAPDHPSKLPTRDQFEASHQAAVQNARAAVTAQHPGANPELDALTVRSKAQYPFIGNVNPVIVPRDKGSEAWPSGEIGSPDYPRPSSIPIGRHGIEVSRGMSEGDVAGEALHLDPFANSIRDKLTQSLSPKQIEYLKHEALDYGTDADAESQQQRMQNAVDSAIRGTLVGQWPAKAVAGMGYTPEQKGLLDQLQTYMKTGKVPPRNAQGQVQSTRPGIAALPPIPEEEYQRRVAGTQIADKPLLPLSGLTPEHPASVASGIAKGAAQFAEGLTTPTNIALMFGTAGVPAVFSRLLAGGFSVSMLKSAYEQSPEVRDAVVKKDWPRAAEAITKLAGTVGFAALAGTRAARGTPAGPSAPSETEAVPRGTEPPEAGSPAAIAPRSTTTAPEAITPDRFMQQEATAQPPLARTAEVATAAAPVESTPQADAAMPLVQPSPEQVAAQAQASQMPPRVETGAGELNPDAFMRQVRTPAATVGNTPESQPVADMAAPQRATNAMFGLGGKALSDLAENGTPEESAAAGAELERRRLKRQGETAPRAQAPDQVSSPIAEAVERFKEGAARGAAEKLRNTASGLENQIQAKLNPGVFNQNPTARRSRIGAGMVQEGERLQRIQKGLNALADLHESGDVPPVLSKVRTRAEFEELMPRFDERGNRIEDRFPRAYLRSGDVRDILEKTKGMPGTKEGRAILERRAGSDIAYFGDEAPAIEKLMDAAVKKGWNDKYSREPFQRARRMQSIGITPENFKAAQDALEALGVRRREPTAEENIAKAERELAIGSKIPGFFPTPKPLAAQMVEQADIRPGMKTLEPSAGNGNIADEMRSAGGDVKVIEPVPTLRDILTQKQYDVAGSDFLEHKDKYDRIVMNPPFERGQDIEHVRHAYDLLKPGGRLVSIMSEGPFGRSDKQATAFREWLDSVNGESEKLPEGSFTGKEALRQTGTATRLVTIDKPELGVGRNATVYTPRETKADVQYQLANMPDLRTSFDPGYDQDLQPRETDRIGSRQRIEELKGTLNPEKLSESVNAGDGAPITLPDGQVLTGNHRTVALRELYDAGHPKAQEYKAWLQENAPRFGLKPEDVAALEQPVLVRRMTNPGDKADLVRFAEEANMSTTARMSDAEQAQMLAKRITGPVMEAFDPREDGTPNPEFVQALLRDLPAQERAAFMDSKGQLSQSGTRMLRNAVFAKAYPDVTAIERMAESNDSNVRNISNGMLAAAPKFARLQEAIAAGDRHSLGIERETTQAAETLNSLKDQGVTVPQWLSQENLFGRDPVVDKLVQSFAENRRSAKRIGEVLKVYTDLVDRLGSPKQEGLFGAEQPPNRAELIEAANEIVRKRNALAEETGKTGELFPEGAAPRSGETGAAGEPRTAEAGDVQNPVARRSEERGSVDLSDLAESMRRRFPGIDPNEPELNYSGLGATKDKWIRNLSQLEEASPRGHEAAMRAGSSESQARVLVATATPKIEAALGKDGPSFQEFRQALIESRLRGLRARWQDFARQAQRQTPDGLKNSLDNGVLDLLKNIEGKRDLPQDLAQTAAALAEHEDWPALGHFLSQTFSDAAERVGSTLTPDEFARTTSSEGFRRALPVYKQLLEQPIAESHARNEGIFSNALGPLETYYPLVPVTAADRIYATVGKRAPYRPPANIANRFATGLGEEYDTGMEAFADRMRAAIKTNNKAAMLTSLADEGLIQPLKPGQQASDMIEYQGRQFHAEVVETAADRTVIKDGKITHVPAEKALVPSFLRRELAPILERNTAAEGEKRLMNLITKIQLLGPLDFAIHGSNLVGTLVANTPFIGDSLLGKAAGSIPFTKRIAALVKIAATDPTTPDAARDLQEMAKLGVLPPRFASQTYSKRFAEQTGAEFHRFSLGPALYGPSGLDARARLVMYRLANDINPEAKPAELGKFVNQLGQYTRELQGEVERSVKSTGFAPFYTAGSTMLRNAVHAWTGTGPMPSDGLTYRLAQQLSGGAAGVVGAWALTYRAYTGKWPWDDRKARLLQIPVNASDRRSPLGRALWGKGPETGYVNFGFFSPMVARGARAMGLTGAFDTHAAHGSAGQAAESAITGAINAVLHPFAGPAVRAAWTAATGTDLYVTGLRDDRGRASPQFLPETKKTAYGWPTVKARAAATAMTLNSFFGNAAVATGFGNGLRAADEKGNKALRMVIDLVAPQLVGRPQNPAARAGYLERQRKAAAGR